MRIGVYLRELEHEQADKIPRHFSTLMNLLKIMNFLRNLSLFLYFKFLFYFKSTLM